MRIITNQIVNCKQALMSEKRHKSNVLEQWSNVILLTLKMFSSTDYVLLVLRVEKKTHLFKLRLFKSTLFNIKRKKDREEINSKCNEIPQENPLELILCRQQRIPTINKLL